VISDTLHDAVAEIDAYLLEDGPYSPDDNLRRYIIAVRDSMEVLRCRLDIDPEGYEPSFRALGDTP
jgi:hypothetical protein